MKKYYIVVFVLILVAFMPNNIDAQCAMCKAAVQSSQDNPNSVAKKLNTGILYLMAVPYLMIAFIFRKQLISLYKSFRGKNMPEENI